MSDWKCEILTEPSNGQESYSPPLEQGYLVEGGSQPGGGVQGLSVNEARTLFYPEKFH